MFFFDHNNWELHLLLRTVYCELDSNISLHQFGPILKKNFDHSHVYYLNKNKHSRLNIVIRIIYLSSFAMYSSYIFTISVKPIMNIFTKRTYNLNARRVMVMKWVSGHTLMKLSRIVWPFRTTTNTKHVNTKITIIYIKKYLQIIYFIMIRMFLIKKSAYIINMISVNDTF